MPSTTPDLRTETGSGASSGATAGDALAAAASITAGSARVSAALAASTGAPALLRGAGLRAARTGRGPFGQSASKDGPFGRSAVSGARALTSSRGVILGAGAAPFLALAACGTLGPTFATASSPPSAKPARSAAATSSVSSMAGASRAEPLRKFFRQIFRPFFAGRRERRRRGNGAAAAGARASRQRNSRRLARQFRGGTSRRSFGRFAGPRGARLPAKRQCLFDPLQDPQRQDQDRSGGDHRPPRPRRASRSSCRKLRSWIDTPEAASTIPATLNTPPNTNKSKYIRLSPALDPNSARAAFKAVL